VKASVAGNDNFANATSLTGTNVTVTNSNVGATAESGEPLPISAQSTLWWTWTAPQDGYVTINTQGTAFNQVLAVYQGTLLTELNQVDAESGNLGTDVSQIQFPVKRGQVYKIQVGSNSQGYSSWTTGTIVMNLSEGSFASGGITDTNVYGAPTTFNDNFANSFNLSGTNFTAVGFNESSTTESSEPLADNDQSTLWWTWTAPQDGYVTITSQGYTQNGNFNTVLSVYQGTFLTQLNYVDYESDNLGSDISQVQFPVKQGQIYKIQVGANSGGYSSWTKGTVLLNLQEDSFGSAGISNTTIFGAPVPFNNLYQNKALVTGNKFTAVGFNVSAGTESGEPLLNNEQNTLWWTWVAPNSGTVTIDTSGTGFNNCLAVYQGTYLTKLTNVAAASDNQSANVSSVSFQVSSGQSYQIQVGANSGGYSSYSTGIVILNLNLPNGIGTKAQTINFPAITAKTLSTTPQTFGLGAIASSGLPVSYSIVSGPASLTGTNVTLTGSLTIQASQAGNATYAPAAPVKQTIQIK